MFPRMRYKAIDVVGLMHCKMPLYLPVCQKLFSDTEYWDWLEMHCWKNARQLLEYFSQGNKKIFSLSTLELVVNKLENLVIFRNSLEGGHMSPPFDPPWPIKRGPPRCHSIYP